MWVFAGINFTIIGSSRAARRGVDFSCLADDQLAAVIRTRPIVMQVVNVDMYDLPNLTGIAVSSGFIDQSRKAH